MTQCRRYAMSGGQCELTEGHDGEHQRSYESGFVLRWTDEQVTEQIRRHSSRFD